MKIILYIIACFSVGIGYSQLIDRSYFEGALEGKIDKLFEHIEVEDGVIISAYYNQGANQEPVVIRLNTEGEVIWSTSDIVTLGTETCSRFEINLFKDNYVYGTSHEGTERTLWKIDASTGEVIWNTNFYSNYAGKMKYAEYDSESFFVSIRSGLSKFDLAKVDKSTGDTIKTKSFTESGANSNTYCLVDDNKNVYFTYERHILKFNGDDFNSIIWRTELSEAYPEVENVYDAYMDQYDDIYLFVSKLDGYTSPRIIKINPLSGVIIWNNQAVAGDLALSDFKDVDGKIISTYEHTTVGGGYYTFSTAKMDKQTGELDWFSYIDIEGTGTGDEQKARSLDFDCDGDIYLTGSFNGFSFGPRDWGNLKINGVDGEQIWMTRTAVEPDELDEKSIGLASCIINNNHIWMGHLEEPSGEVYPRFVRYDSETGDELSNSYIGNSYKQQSVTLAIQNHNDSVYVLKQLGDEVVLEAYNTDNTLLWDHIISSENVVLGGQMSISDSLVFLSVYYPHMIDSQPYFSDETDSIGLFKLNRYTGSVGSWDILDMDVTVSKPLELESDNGKAYLLYMQNDTNYLRRWEDTFFLPAIYLEPSGNNVNSKGNLNILLNDSMDEILYYLGTEEILEINKVSYSSAALLTHVAPLELYDGFLDADTLYVGGNDEELNQRMIAYNLDLEAEIWNESYAADGTGFCFVKSDSILYMSFQFTDGIYLKAVNSSTGAELWTIIEPATGFDAAIPLDLTYNPEKDFLVLVGYKYNADQSEGLIVLYHPTSESKYSFLEPGVENTENRVICSANLSNNNVWVGGLVNSLTHLRSGFLHEINYCNTDTTIYVDLMDEESYESPSGEIYSESGTYIDIIPNEFGCDSIIQVVLNLEFSTSIKELESDDIFIFPNPASETITVKGILSKNTALKFVDVTGKTCLVINDYFEGQSVSISHLANGIYYVYITRNDELQSIRMIKI